MIPTFFLVIIPRKITRNNNSSEPICIIKNTSDQNKSPFLSFKRRKDSLRGTTLIHPFSNGCAFPDTDRSRSIFLSANGQVSGSSYFLIPGFQMAALRPVLLPSPGSFHHPDSLCKVPQAYSFSSWHLSCEIDGFDYSTSEEKMQPFR